MKVFKFGHKVNYSLRIVGNNVQEQYNIEFENGYGASIIKSNLSYGGEEGLYELAILDKENNIIDEEIDVLGFLDSQEVKVLLGKIKTLSSDDHIAKSLFMNR